MIREDKLSAVDHAGINKAIWQTTIVLIDIKNVLDSIQYVAAINLSTFIIYKGV